MILKEKDFVEVEYTGKTQDGIVFDTTDEKTAKENGIHNPGVNYGPVVVCLGQNQLLKGLDNKLIGSEIGSHKFDLKPEEGFGKKSAKLIQLVSTSKFKKQEIIPQPGLQVNIDGQVGIIKTVSGGRTLVDFNHPLSGMDVVYEIKVNKKIEDPKEKVESVIKLEMGIQNLEVEVKEKEASIFIDTELPKDITNPFAEKIKDLTGLNKVEFKKKPEKKTEENKKSNSPASSKEDETKKNDDKPAVQENKDSESDTKKNE